MNEAIREYLIYKIAYWTTPWNGKEDYEWFKVKEWRKEQ